MIYYKLTNISGGLLVCDLITEGKTLRLQHKQSAVVPESEITDHLWNLIVKYLILCSESHTTDEEYNPDSGGNSGGSSGGNSGGNDSNTQVSTRGAVRYDAKQSLSKDEKLTARRNIDAQETLIECVPSVTLSNKTGLDTYYVLLENYEVCSTYLVRVSEKCYALEELEGLVIKKYNSETGFVSETPISSEDVTELTPNGSMMQKDCLFVVVSNKDDKVSLKGVDITFEGTYLLFEDYGSYALYLEIEIPETLVFKDGVTKIIDENSEDKTLPTAKAVFDFVQGQKFVKEETVNSLVEEVGKELDEKLTGEDLNKHNVDNTAHNDLRVLIQQYVNAVQTILDSDDETLDQMSEVVAYIKNNKSLIDNVTTTKVNISDIIDNLTTNVSNKPLSAAQGVVLKQLIDAIVIPTMLSQLSDDATHRVVTDTEKQVWNSKADGGHTHDTATTSTNGFLSSADKAKLDTVAQNANNYTHPGTHPASMITGLHSVATSGSYNDLSGAPKIDKTLSETSTDENVPSSKAVYNAIPAWARESNKPTYTASEVGADPKNTASSMVSEHNINNSAHNDIRLLVTGLTSRLNALVDTDDTTLDQLSEIVAYIKSNKELIDAITTSKVNVTDIIDNLVTNVSNKPLSASMGVAIKALIDAKAESDHTHNYYTKGYYNESDGLFYEDSSFEKVIVGEGSKFYLDVPTTTMYIYDGSLFVVISGKSTEDIEYITDEEYEEIMKEVGI